MCMQNLKFVALLVPEIIGGTQKCGQSLDTPTIPFVGFVRMDPLNVPAKFEVCSAAFPVLDVIAIEPYGRGCQSPILVKRRQ